MSRESWIERWRDVDRALVTESANWPAESKLCLKVHSWLRRRGASPRWALDNEFGFIDSDEAPYVVLRHADGTEIERFDDVDSLLEKWMVD